MNNVHPCPILSCFVYFLFGSPTETIVRNFSRISSSVIFFLLCRSFLAPTGISGSIGLVYWKQQNITSIENTKILFQILKCVLNVLKCNLFNKWDKTLYAVQVRPKKIPEFPVSLPCLIFTSFPKYFYFYFIFILYKFLCLLFLFYLIFSNYIKLVFN